VSRGIPVRSFSRTIEILSNVAIITEADTPITKLEHVQNIRMEYGQVVARVGSGTYRITIEESLNTENQGRVEYFAVCTDFL